MMRLMWLLAVVPALSAFAPMATGTDTDFVEMPADVLADKIAGGLLGQLFGNLNGLPHEFKYIDTPGSISDYTPALPEGAWTDDDTDIEWVYIVEMQRSGKLLIPAQRIVELWRKHINERIWCANLYARTLMDLGIDPPWTGRMGINPWATFNISGQFVCETFGLIAPAMPQTACRTALHYTEVAIDGEPAQTTQLFATMIAMAFVESDIAQLVGIGRSAVDPHSETFQVVGKVREWWQENPDDWRATRQKILNQYTRHGGKTLDRNGCVLNTAAVIGALLHGQGDFVKTVQLAFNFGWDADCNAATAATVLGVIKGRAWMLQQKWVIADRYENRTRPGMPDDETISRFSERVLELARKAILANGGNEKSSGDTVVFVFRSQKPANITPLVSSAQRLEELRGHFLPLVENELTDPFNAARAAYLAICLGEAEQLAKIKPQAWQHAIAELRKHTNMVTNMLKAPGPDGAALREKAKTAGLRMHATESQ